MNRSCGLPLVYIKLRHLTFRCSSGAAQSPTTKHCSCSEQLPGEGLWLSECKAAPSRNRKDDARLARHTEWGWDSKLQELLLRICVCVSVCVCTDQDCTPGSRRRSTWRRGSWTCRCACFLRTPASSRSRSRPCGGNGRSRCLWGWSCTDTQMWLLCSCCLQNKNCGCLKMSCICCNQGTSPFPLVHVELVQVSSQAVLVGTEGLVASVDVDRSGAGVEHAAVAVSSLDQRAVRVHQAPRVLGWRGQTNIF